MFKHIFLFELQYRLRRPSTYVYFGLYFLIGLLYGSILAGAFGPESVGMITQGGQNLANSPYNLHLILMGVGQIGIFATAAFMGVTVFRDYQRDVHSLFFTKPISKWSYLGGRFTGSFLITIVVLFSIALGMMLAEFLPFTEEAKYGPFHVYFYLKPYLLSIIPFTFFTAAIFFATVSLSRNQLFIYLNAILILVLLSVASGITSTLDNKLLASLIDPTGSAAFLTETEYWTVAEKNTQTIPFSAIIVGNQLIWVAVGLLILAFTYVKFQFSYLGTKAQVFRPKKSSTLKLIADTVKLKQIKLPLVHKSFNLRNHLSQLWLLSIRESRQVLLSPIFLVLMLVGVLMFVTIMAFEGTMFGTPTLPLTYRMIDVAMGSFALFILAIIVFYSGEMVWKERGVKIHQIYDALPIPNWLSLSSKMLAMFAIIAATMLVLMLCGIVSQLVQGYFRIELGLYLQTLFGYRILNYFLFAALAFFIQVMTNNKYLGFFLTAGIYLFIQTFFGMLGIEHKLFRFMSSTGLPYSDMNGFGHYVWPFLTFKIYWGSLAAIFMILSFVFWVRGPETHWKTRLSIARSNIGRREVMGLITAVLLFMGMGSYIYYNTNVLNEYQNSRDRQKLRAEYEKKYKRFEGIPQPKIIDIKLNIDIFPERQDFHATGHYILKNKQTHPIDSVHLLLNEEVAHHELRFSRSTQQVLKDEEINYHIYTLDKPLQAGDTMSFYFELDFISKGFTNSGLNTEVIENGTFFSHAYFPSFAYEAFYELRDKGIRKKYGLSEEIDRFPAIDDTLAIYNNLFVRDADWIDFEATVSTSKDQIAIVPGYLQKKWEENDRNYFYYKMDSKMVKFYSIVSARYEVMRDQWKAPDGRDIQLEIYHHPDHTYNLDRMMQGMKETLAYCTENFGPYQHQQIRILEFPRYRTFAQSFANTVPFSEGAGFIADVGEGDVDYPLYITAHEVAHQWWAHQVVGGYVQGFQFLSETMSQYTALMVMEKLLGADEIKKYLKHEMNSYLTGRTAEHKKEMPALLSENQLYIHYNKGSVIMYALKDYIGEDSLNLAMKRYVSQVRHQEPPYTTTREWLKYVREVTPDSLNSVLYDLFESVTLFDNSIESATYEEIGGRYKVILNIKAKKLRDDGEGNETDVVLDDYIDIGVFGREKVDGKWKDIPLYLQKHKITQTEQQIEVWVDSEAREAGIDPYYKLIDRNPRDNMKRVKAN